MFVELAHGKTSYKRCGKGNQSFNPGFCPYSTEITDFHGHATTPEVNENKVRVVNKIKGNWFPQIKYVWPRAWTVKVLKTLQKSKWI